MNNVHDASPSAVINQNVIEDDRDFLKVGNVPLLQNTDRISAENNSN